MNINLRHKDGNAVGLSFMGKEGFTISILLNKKSKDELCSNDFMVSTKGTENISILTKQFGKEFTRDGARQGYYQWNVAHDDMFILLEHFY